MDEMTAALLAERALHVKFGRPRHVALVDRELAKLGHQVAAAPPPETPAPAPPETTQAAAPPEDSAVPRPVEHVCDECDPPRKFRTAASLGSHRRVHER